jgi:hypothetical protein
LGQVQVLGVDPGYRCLALMVAAPQEQVAEAVGACSGWRSRGPRSSPARGRQCGRGSRWPGRCDRRKHRPRAPRSAATRRRVQRAGDDDAWPFQRATPPARGRGYNRQVRSRSNEIRLQRRRPDPFSPLEAVRAPACRFRTAPGPFNCPLIDAKRQRPSNACIHRRCPDVNLPQFVKVDFARGRSVPATPVGRSRERPVSGGMLILQGRAGKAGLQQQPRRRGNRALVGHGRRATARRRRLRRLHVARVP